MLLYEPLLREENRGLEGIEHFVCGRGWLSIPNFLLKPTETKFDNGENGLITNGK